MFTFQESFLCVLYYWRDILLKLQIRNKKNQKGSILLYSLIISMIVLTIGLSIAQIVLTEIKASGDAASSQQAYYAAETGLEEGLLNPSDDYIASETCYSGVCWVVTKDSTTGKITAKGQSGGIYRSLEILFTSSGGGKSEKNLIAVGSNHSLAVTSAGNVLAWGFNTEGQLGDNTISDRSLPKKVNNSDNTGYLQNIIEVAGGLFFSAALDANGNVWTWGDNDNGQLGVGIYSDDIRLPVLVKNESGTGSLSNIVKIACGVSFCVANDSINNLWSWGSNSRGQLGNGTTNNSNLPVKVKNSDGTGYLTGTTKISTSSTHVMALSSSGNIWTWGYNWDGRLGDGSKTDRSLPVLVKDSSGSSSLSDIVSISAGGTHSLALNANGNVWAWGSNSGGQLGDNTTKDKVLPVRVKDSAGIIDLLGIKQIFAGSGGTSMAKDQDANIWAWGSNGSGRLGDGTTINRGLPVRVNNESNSIGLSGVSLIVVSGHALSFYPDGKVISWGVNTYGQLGNGSTTNSYFPGIVKDESGSGSLDIF